MVAVEDQWVLLILSEVSFLGGPQSELAYPPKTGYSLLFWYLLAETISSVAIAVL
jgi:hypothetical protein